MVYTVKLIYFLNIALLACTLAIYFFAINLWNDSALILSSLIGSCASGATLLSLAVKWLKKKTDVNPPLVTRTFIIATCFAVQAITLAYCLWLKTY